jgi:arylsulfatase A-like enzyme
MDKESVGIRAKGAMEKRGFCVRGRRDRPSEQDLATIVGFYDAAIHMGDRMVGRFLDAVRSHGLMDNTVILLTADHGDEFFEHGNCDHVRFLYREIVNVPFMVHVPGLSPERISEVVPASIAVTRTLLDLVGIEHDMPGVSLVPTLRGQRYSFGAVFSEADSIVGALGSRGATIAMTSDRYKLISYLEEGADEAYDIEQDPGEQEILPEANEAYAARPTLRAWHTATDPASRTTAVASNGPASTEAERPRGKPQREGVARAAKVPGAQGTADRKPNARNAKPPATEEPTLEMPDKLKDELRSLGYFD